MHNRDQSEWDHSAQPAQPLHIAYSEETLAVDLDYGLGLGLRSGARPQATAGAAEQGGMGASLEVVVIQPALTRLGRGLADQGAGGRVHKGRGDSFPPSCGALPVRGAFPRLDRRRSGGGGRRNVWRLLGRKLGRTAEGPGLHYFL